MKRPARVLFVCIGNSCRSPMAEAFARHLGAGAVEASSAGLFPAAIIQPETFQAMAERGVNLENAFPRSLFLMNGAEFDLVVNMTGGPLAGLMPGFAGREVVWEVRDPIGQKIETYRAVRDQIEKRVADLIEQLQREPE